jgi:hypothetical protein
MRSEVFFGWVFFFSASPLIGKPVVDSYCTTGCSIDLPYIYICSYVDFLHERKTHTIFQIYLPYKSNNIRQNNS